MKGIAINGKMLHKVEMAEVPYSCGRVCRLLYPKSRIEAEFSESKITLKIPSFLAVELYRTGVLPQSQEETFPVSVGGKRIGFYKIIDFLYPNSTLYDDRVIISLEQVVNNKSKGNSKYCIEGEKITSIEYVNRKEHIYFLHEGKTKKGNPRYTFSQSKEKALAFIPKGYEIYENPNAQVFLRKIQARVIREDEETLVKNVFKVLIDSKYCKLTIIKEVITIYFANQDVDTSRYNEKTLGK